MRRLTALTLAVLAMVALGACYDPEGLRDLDPEAESEDGDFGDSLLGKVFGFFDDSTWFSELKRL